MARLTLQREEVAFQGKVNVGMNTKALLRSIQPHRIAVLVHENIDEMAAHGLIEAKVKAVINAAPTMNGHYPLYGPAILLRAGIPIIEIARQDYYAFEDDMDIIVDQSSFIQLSEHTIASVPFTLERWMILNEQAQNNIGKQLNHFIDNTLNYAALEKNMVISPMSLPFIKTVLHNKPVLIVVRGRGYKQDLLTLQHYINTVKPVLIGVDGGADAMLRLGYKPDLIVGDMDSVSDEALYSGAELIVHAYRDGRAPGLQRLHELNLNAATIEASGTSEDVALLLAYEKKAKQIVTVGAHTCMNEFLAKGRKGMGSTMLVRMKVGAKLIDAKGISMLFPGHVNDQHGEEVGYAHAHEGFNRYPSVE